MSNWFARRLRLLLWVVAGLLAAGLFAYIAYAEVRPTRTDRVNEYIGQVNEIERELSIEISHVNQAYQQFAEARPADELVPKLREAEHTIGVLRTRVRRLHPPAEAQRLHSALLRLLTVDSLVASEVTRTAMYLDALARLGRPLDAAAETLRRDLQRAASPDEQANVFRAYASRVQAVRKRADAVLPPAAFAPSHLAFTRRLRESSILTHRLAAAAAEGDAAAASSTVARLQALSAAEPSIRRAERAAIRAYNERAKEADLRIRDVVRARDELSRALA